MGRSGLPLVPMLRAGTDKPRRLCQNITYARRRASENAGSHAERGNQENRHGREESGKEERNRGVGMYIDGKLPSARQR